MYVLIELTTCVSETRMGSYLTLPLLEGYCKWFGKKSVCVSGHPAVPQELDTPGLPYLACIHFSKVARTSTR